LESQLLALLRESLVGTLATIYSVEVLVMKIPLKIKWRRSQSNYGKEGVQLRIRDLIIVVLCFALQCASTIAITRKETNSWKWPLGQLILMSAFAYIVALIAYQILK
jgi:ferrous iron transport protein B